MIMSTEVNIVLFWCNKIDIMYSVPFQNFLYTDCDKAFLWGSLIIRWYLDSREPKFVIKPCLVLTEIVADF